MQRPRSPIRRQDITERCGPIRQQRNGEQESAQNINGKFQGVHHLPEVRDQDEQRGQDQAETDQRKNTDQQRGKEQTGIGQRERVAQDQRDQEVAADHGQQGLGHVGQYLAVYHHPHGRRGSHQRLQRAGPAFAGDAAATVEQQRGPQAGHARTDHHEDGIVRAFVLQHPQGHERHNQGLDQDTEDHKPVDQVLAHLDLECARQDIPVQDQAFHLIPPIRPPGVRKHPPGLVRA